MWHSSNFISIAQKSELCQKVLKAWEFVYKLKLNNKQHQQRYFVVVCCVLLTYVSFLLSLLHFVPPPSSLLPNQRSVCVVVLVWLKQVLSAGVLPDPLECSGGVGSTDWLQTTGWQPAWLCCWLWVKRIMGQTCWVSPAWEAVKVFVLKVIV